MKLISSKTHGILDYLTVIFFAVSPTVFNMQGHLKELTYAMACIHLLLTILTRFELGVIKIIPFKIHGLIEFIVSIAFIAVSLLFNHHGNALGFQYYLWMALIILIVFMLTDFRSTNTGGN